MIIYKVTNKVNGKQYIGRTVKKINVRWNEHACNASSDKEKDQSILHKALRKYGKENFSIEQIDSANSIEELNQKEIYWIEKLNTRVVGYNLTAGGEGFSKKHSDKTKKLISDHNGMKNNPESRKKSSESHIGQLAWNKGKIDIYSKESLESNRQKHLGKFTYHKLSIEQKLEIIQKYKTGKYTQKQLATEYKVKQSNISIIILINKKREGLLQC